MKVRVIGRAKVNLWLHVLGRRPDGYHEINTLMQTIEWCDELEMERSHATSVEFESGPVPDRPDLVERTLEIMNQTAAVLVRKSIPIGSGLGGGSADAAAVILGLGGSPEIAAQVGSDVPFALQGGTALATGRGEKLSRVECPQLWWVVGVPDFSMSTAEVYDLAAPGAGDPIRNDLEDAAFKLAPSLRPLKDEMVSAGAIRAMMSGSGPAIAGLCRDEEHANQLARRVSGSFAVIKAVSSARMGAEIR